MADTVQRNRGIIPAIHASLPRKDRNSLVGIIPFPVQLSKVALISFIIFSGAPSTTLLWNLALFHGHLNTKGCQGVEDLGEVEISELLGAPSASAPHRRCTPVFAPLLDET